MLTVAHISDTHFGRAREAVPRAERVLRYLARMNPPVDVVLHTGDITEHGTLVEYAEAWRVLAETTPLLGVPLLTCPGNHDVRGAYVQVFGGADDGQPTDHAVTVNGALVLMLDSLIPAPPGERIDAGRLGPASLNWLQSHLHSYPDTPTLIALHHPPTTVGVPWLDRIMLENADELASVLAGHQQVVAILAGHAHGMVAADFAGLPVLVGGGISSTIPLDAEPFEGATADLAPSFALHVIEDGRIVTHFRTVD